MISIYQKLISEMYKLLYKISHSRSYHHNRKRWPYVKISRSDCGEIIHLEYKKKSIDIKPISFYRKQHSGEVLLVATGPSIAEINFNKSINFPVFGVNGAYTLKNHLNFNFYIITDEHFFEHRPEIMLDVISNPNITLFIILDVLIQLIERCNDNQIKCSIVIIENYCSKIYQPKLRIEELDKTIFDFETTFLSLDKKNIAFTLDIRNGIFAEKTVIYWALQVIPFLGFDKIYIAGLDMNNFDKPRFYETQDDKIHTQLQEDYESIMSGFTLASKVFKQKNIDVINLSKNSAIPESIFRKSNYKHFFNS